MSKESGFWIIELLVVVAIFGILGLIAIPQYSVYRERVYSAQATKDLRDVAAAEEKFFGKNGSYQAISHCEISDPHAQCDISDLPGITSLSRGMRLSVTALPHGFRGVARHVKSDITCRWDSTQGGMLGCSKVQ